MIEAAGELLPSAMPEGPWTLRDGLTVLFTGLGLGFFLAGTVGLLRFPDSFSRLHALTKADNLGLGFLALGLAFQAEGVGQILRLGLIWVLALLAAGVAAQLVSRAALADAARRGPE